MTMQLMLSDIWRPEAPNRFKVHFARFNQQDQPLRVLARSLDEWRDWQAWHPGRNEFNRPWIFSLAQMPGQPDLWMFGGIWEVRGIFDLRDGGGRRYDVALSDALRPVVGRLKLHRVHRDRGTRLNFENHYEHFAVHEILAEPYTGRDFPGYAAVNLSFQELESLIHHGRQDWATALAHVKGVYLITDAKTKRRYVGSAYGDEGVWSRWRAYVEGGHGGNVELRAIVADHSLDYCRRHFRFTLLEHFDARMDDVSVIARESYWKDVLDTRNVETGLNRN